MDASPDTGSETDLADLEAAAIEDPGPVELILRWSKGIEVRPLNEGESMTFGRSSTASFAIPDSRVSRLHACIAMDQRVVWVEDLGSRNGTFVGRHHLRKERRQAHPGDLVRVGPLEIVIAQLPARDDGSPEADGIVVADPSMRQVFEIARRLSLTQTTVLIVGETGSGKEVVAEQIHRWSARKSGPFVRLNCATLPAHLLESANGGTLLLDEIGELSSEMQAKLLSVLENRHLDRVPIDVRIICSTHRDLEVDVKSGRFRQDLYYRINTFVLRVPPLRERPEEIQLLANHYVQSFGRSLGVPRPSLDASACAALVRHAWPGNVRELKNAMEHAMVLATDGVVRSEHLPRSVTGESEIADPGNLVDRLADVERQTILDALRLEGGNQTKAAQRLGITRRALLYRIERLGLRRD